MTELMINVDVPDLERAIRFYEDALGLHLRRKLFGGTVAEMGGAAAPLFLLAKSDGSAASPGAAHRRDYARHWTPVHLDFAVEDIVAAVARATAVGARLEGEIESLTWGLLATLSDPFGHGFCLVQWRGRGYGEVE